MFKFEFGKSRKKLPFLSLERETEEVVLPEPIYQAILWDLDMAGINQRKLEP